MGTYWRTLGRKGGGKNTELLGDTAQYVHCHFNYSTDIIITYSIINYGRYVRAWYSARQLF